jgi:hypothetical protein
MRKQMQHIRFEKSSGRSLISSRTYNAQEINSNSLLKVDDIQKRQWYMQT